jgi:hypothetical protein
MEDEAKSSRVEVAAAWRKEQQAKRDAYEATRRAWARTLEHGTDVEECEIPAPEEATASGAAETEGVVSPERRGRRGRTILDRRQTRFTF